jgi:oligosaccharide 4-alpha-D-glucosyltransferase
MRPLFFAEPDNAKIYGDATSYLSGDAFLVSPVVKPVVTMQHIYFPAGRRWFDFTGGGTHEGGSEADMALALDHIPIYVKGGAFVPMVEPAGNTAQYSTHVSRCITTSIARSRPAAAS